MKSFGFLLFFEKLLFREFFFNYWIKVMIFPVTDIFFLQNCFFENVFLSLQLVELQEGCVKAQGGWLPSRHCPSWLKGLETEISDAGSGLEGLVPRPLPFLLFLMGQKTLYTRLLLLLQSWLKMRSVTLRDKELHEYKKKT